MVAERRQAAQHRLSEYDRTRAATLVTWCSMARAADLLCVSAATLERAIQGEAVQERTDLKIVAGLDRLYDEIEPACVRLVRSLA